MNIEKRPPGVSRGVWLEAYARHAFTLAGWMRPTDQRPEFDILLKDKYSDTLIPIGVQIYNELLSSDIGGEDGILLFGGDGELKDRIGTPLEFEKEILYHLSVPAAVKEIKACSRPVNGEKPDDMRLLAIFALSEPEAFCNSLVSRKDGEDR